MKELRMLVLKGHDPVRREDQEQNFTDNERATALAIAKAWDGRGWMPWLASKTAGGDFRVLYNFRRPKKKAA